MADEKEPQRGAPFGGLDPEEFRRHAHWAVDWAADYLSSVGDRPVLSQVAPGEVRSSLPASPPALPEPMDRILADFESVVMPGITHWNHPAFMAYFAISGSPAGIIADMIAATLNVNAMLWRTSPSATELEELVIEWLRQMLGLAPGFEGFICDTASMSTFLALAAARYRAVPDVRERGILPTGKRLRLYCSTQAHSSVEKAAIALGVGRDGVGRIPVDRAYRMQPALLAEAIRLDRANGLSPFAVVATVGTTSTTSIDPVPDIADVCDRERLWLHVDGAYGGVAAVLAELRHVLAGCDRADSLVVNPHKWLMTQIDCSALLVRDIEELKAAFSLVPEYLRTAEGASGQVKDLMDYGVQLGRRFRALKLWFVMRAYGSEGLASHIRAHCRLARQFEAWVRGSGSFEVLAPVPFSTVCFRYHPPGVDDENELARLNAELMDAVNASGQTYLSHTELEGRYSMRLAIGNMATRIEDVERTWTLLSDLARQLR